MGTFKPVPHLDNKHVVFGRLVSGWAVLEAIEAVGSESGEPSSRVVITDCGECRADTAEPRSQATETTIERIRIIADTISVALNRIETETKELEESTALQGP